MQACECVSRLASPIVNCRTFVQVDHETLVEKLQEVNEAQLKLVQPKLVKVLGNRSQAALGRVEREAARVQQSIDRLDAQRMPVKKRQYAFAKKEAVFADPDGSALGETNTGPLGHLRHQPSVLRHTLGRGYSMYDAGSGSSGPFSGLRRPAAMQATLAQIRLAKGESSFSEQDEHGEPNLSGGSLSSAQSSPWKAPQSPLSSTTASLDNTLPSAVK